VKPSECTTIIDEAKFLESHLLRSEIGGVVNQAFIERLELYNKLKQDESK
jgi:hypothetical protein